MADYEYATRDFRDDPDSEVEVTRKDSTNWLPLLLIPVALLVGWFGKDAVDNSANRNLSSQTSPVVGVGGGPVSPIPCTTPAIQQ